MKRRAFLGATAAAGTTAALVAVLRDRFAAAWDTGAAAPLTTRELTISRGPLPETAVARLELWLHAPEGVEGFPRCVHTEAMPLSEPLTRRALALSYDHPRLQPGRWCYVARVQVEAEAVEAELAYTLHPFVFGV